MFNTSYLVEVAVDKNDVYLKRHHNSDSATTLITFTDILGNYDAGEWWSCRLHWQTDNDHVLEVYDQTGTLVDSASVNDGTHVNNGTFGTVQYKGASDVSQYLDNVEII